MARGRQRHFSGDFKQNPDLDSSSQIVSVIQCLQTSSQGTNLESPIQDDSFGRPSGMNHLLTAGRPGVKKGIILLSDGEANQPYANTSCEYAFDMALRAKNTAIEVFTIGFGVEDGNNAQCGDSGTAHQSVPVTQLLADMTTQPIDNDCSAGNTDAENQDGDHFLVSRSRTTCRMSSLLRPARS